MQWRNKSVIKSLEIRELIELEFPSKLKQFLQSEIHMDQYQLSSQRSSLSPLPTMTSDTTWSWSSSCGLKVGGSNLVQCTMDQSSKDSQWIPVTNCQVEVQNKCFYLFNVFFLILELEDMSPLSQCCDGQSVPWQRRNLRCVMINVDLCFEWQNYSNHYDGSLETWNIMVPMEICLDGARMLCSRWCVSPLTMESVSPSTPQTQAPSRLRSSPLQLTGADSAISVAVY